MPNVKLKNLELKNLLERAKEKYNNMTDNEKEEMLREQRKSWVLGEMAMGSDRDEAEYKNALNRNDKEKLKQLDFESEQRRQRALEILNKKKDL